MQVKTNKQGSKAKIQIKWRRRQAETGEDNYKGSERGKTGEHMTGTSNDHMDNNIKNKIQQEVNTEP